MFVSYKAVGGLRLMAWCTRSELPTPRPDRLCRLPKCAVRMPGEALYFAGRERVGEYGDDTDEVGEIPRVVPGHLTLASSPCRIGGLAPSG